LKSTTTEPFSPGVTRVTPFIARRLAEELSAETPVAVAGSDQRKALTVERAEIAAGLPHASEDIEIAAERFAPALCRWVDYVRPKLQWIARQTEKEAAPIRREARRLSERNGVGTPGRDLEPPARAKETAAKAAEAWSKVEPLRQRRDRAVELAGQVLGLATSRFDQSIDGGYGS
jgi:hypothetical protein